MMLACWTKVIDLVEVSERSVPTIVESARTVHLQMHGSGVGVCENRVLTILLTRGLHPDQPQALGLAQVAILAERMTAFVDRRCVEVVGTLCDRDPLAERLGMAERNRSQSDKGHYEQANHTRPKHRRHRRWSRSHHHTDTALEELWVTKRMSEPSSCQESRGRVSGSDEGGKRC